MCAAFEQFRTDVMRDELAGEPGLTRLLRREVAPLWLGYLVEAAMGW